MTWARWALAGLIAFHVGQAIRLLWQYRQKEKRQIYRHVPWISVAYLLLLLAALGSNFDRMAEPISWRYVVTAIGTAAGINAMRLLSEDIAKRRAKE